MYMSIHFTDPQIYIGNPLYAEYCPQHHRRQNLKTAVLFLKVVSEVWSFRGDDGEAWEHGQWKEWRKESETRIF